MMKIILLLILFISIVSEQCDNFNGIPTQEADCYHQLSEQQKNDLKKTHCCYFISDDQVDPKCISLTQVQFENIDDYIEYNEILWGYINVRINCNSYHFKITIFYIFFALFMIFGL